jgi:ribosome-binding protein aMBF1 (putative translation factor)
MNKQQPIQNKTDDEQQKSEPYNNKERVSKFKDINDRFILLHKAYGGTQEEFAKFLGMNVSAVRAIYAYRITPNYDVLRRLHQKCGKSYDWLIDGKADYPKE